MRDFGATATNIGDFGTLACWGMDWADPALLRKSTELMAEKVMPTVNAAIGKRVAGNFLRL